MDSLNLKTWFLILPLQLITKYKFDPKPVFCSPVGGIDLDPVLDDDLLLPVPGAQLPASNLRLIILCELLIYLKESILIIKFMSPKILY